MRGHQDKILCDVWICSKKRLWICRTQFQHSPRLADQPQIEYLGGSLKEESHSHDLILRSRCISLFVLINSNYDFQSIRSHTASITRYNATSTTAERPRLLVHLPEQTTGSIFPWRSTVARCHKLVVFISCLHLPHRRHSEHQKCDCLYASLQSVDSTYRNRA